jgi:hypothetical protein
MTPSTKPPTPTQSSMLRDFLLGVVASTCAVLLVAFCVGALTALWVS